MHLKTARSAECSSEPAPASAMPLPRVSRALRALQQSVGAPGEGLDARTTDPAGNMPPEMSQLLVYFRGRSDLVHRTLELFGGECQRLVHEMGCAIDRADLVETALAAHRLKGAAATAAAELVRDAAERVEGACRRERADEVIAAYADLEREALRAGNRIERALAGLASEERVPGTADEA